MSAHRRACAVTGLIAILSAVSPARADDTALATTLAAEDRAALAREVLHAGDAREGSRLFHTRHLSCTQCHAAGEGESPLGPNLAAMPDGVSRERLVAHIIESLLEPSASVAPRYRGVTIVTDDGRSLSGLVDRETDADVVLRDAAAGGREIAVPKAAIEERLESRTSLMPAGLVNLLADRRQFTSLVRFLAAIAEGGPPAAARLAPEPSALVPQALPAYEADIDHAGFIADWQDPERSRAAIQRGGELYGRVCANCHGTLEGPGSLPSAPRFTEARFKAGSDPHAIYRTLTHGVGLMLPQDWMVPRQKYDVIHYIRETFLRERNPAWYTTITADYLASLPTGKSRGPEPATVEPWRLHEYGPFLAGTFEVGQGGGNVARKGLAVQLDPSPGGIGRGHAWMLYELDTLRAAAFWTGDTFIDWRGINFDGRHNAHPRVAGDVQAALPTMPGWSPPGTGDFTDPRPLGRDGRPYGPLPREHARFRALHHAATIDTASGEQRSVVVLDYLVGEIPVLESSGLAAPLTDGGASIPVAVRVFSLGPRPQPLTVRLAATPAAAALVAPPRPDADGAGPRIVTSGGHVDLVIPAGDAPLDVAVAVASADPTRLAAHAATLEQPTPPRRLVGRPAPPLRAAPVESAITSGPDAGPFAVDTFAPPVPNPWQAQVRFSGLDFTGPDEAVLCTWDGDVWIVGGITAPGGRITWRRIASGLFQPLGIRVIDGVIHVGCRDRIVTLVDLDGDRMIDRYDTFNDDHQVTEHFHEFAMGLETDADGNVYYAKSGCHGLPAVVPHHGTLLKVAPDGSTTGIVATGFRAANGVCVNEDGTLWVTDQEGFWCPKNRINLVRSGGFYGNMWAWTDVTDASDSAMEPPAFWITNSFDRSPAELVRVSGTAWQPLTGGLLELSYGMGRIHLVLTEPATARPGLVQGGMVALPMPDLPTGVMRGRFHPDDGQFYVCGLYAWAGNRTQPGGFFRVRRTPRPVTIPLHLHAEPGTIALTFTEPLDRATAGRTEAWTVKTWTLERSERYGSPHRDETPRPVEAVGISDSGRTVTLRVPGFAATWCYSLEWRVATADGEPLQGSLHGTLH